MVGQMASGNEFWESIGILSFPIVPPIWHLHPQLIAVSMAIVVLLRIVIP